MTIDYKTRNKKVSISQVNFYDIFQFYKKEIIPYKFTYFLSNGSIIDLEFEESNFSHLIGVHKLYKAKKPLEIINEILNKKITIGEFTIISVYFSMILNIIKYFFNIGQEYQVANGSLERLIEIKNFEKEKNGVTTLENITRIEAINFNYTFNDKNLYKNELNLTFEKNNIYCLIGKNGCGKSTLVNALIGINKLNKKGTIKLEDNEIEKLDMYDIRKNCTSYMPQKEFFRMITVEDFLKESNNINISDIDENYLFKNLFFSEFLNLNDILKKNLPNLSGGEKQLVSLLTTVLKNSDIYIFDEPTSNLNSNLIEPFLEYLNYLKSQDKIIIIISHDKKIIQNIENSIIL